MIQRHTHPEMGAIWSEQRRYETWLEVELAATDAMAASGLVPAEAARERPAPRSTSPGSAKSNAPQHDVIAFTTAVAEKAGPVARWLHFGLTSSDVVDTAQALQMREACGLIIKGLRLMEAVRGRAEEHRRTPMIGRTHGVHAEPMTFVKLALSTRNRSATSIAAARPRRCRRRQALGCRWHVRAPRSGDRSAGLPPVRTSSAWSRRRSFSGTATPSCRRWRYGRVAREIRPRDSRPAEN